jgi:hypothetical protein
MSETVPLSIRVPEAVNTALEKLADEGKTSKSEIARYHLQEACVDNSDALPEHVKVRVERNELKERNEVVWQRIHFPSNVADRFTRAFEQGDLDGAMGDYAVDDLRRIHVEDAETLFEDDDRQEQAIEYVNAVAEHAKEASDASDFERLDPEEMFERYAGVEDGRAKEDFETVVRDAKRRIQGQRTVDENALATALSNEHGVSEDVAREAINTVQTHDDDADDRGGNYV